MAGKKAEKTLVLIKPDAVKRGLIGTIIHRYEAAGLEIEKMKWTIPSETVLKEHYAEHIDKPFYGDLSAFMQSGPVVAMVLSGNEAVARVRQINGATDFKKADCGSIRGHYGCDITENLVHGSDSVYSAQREIRVWF